MTSTDMPTALIEQPAQAVVAAQSAKNDWAETALTLLFAAAGFKRKDPFVCGHKKVRSALDDTVAGQAFESLLGIQEGNAGIERDPTDPSRGSDPKRAVFGQEKLIGAA